MADRVANPETRSYIVRLCGAGTPSAEVWFMIDPAELARSLVQRLHAELEATAANDAVWIDELERRRRELAAEGERLLERMKLAAGA